MNSFIETLNQWGGNFLTFAWPMLWQSSLLIMALFAIDLLLRRRLRASIRYALWLVVLVKLCVPPTLALPTGPAWWLHKTPPPVVAKSLPHYTVTYDNGPLPEISQASFAAVVPPKPVMTNAAWLLAISTVVSSALLLWLLVRWWQVARMIRSATATEEFSEALEDALRLVGTPDTVPASSLNNHERAGTVPGVPNTGRTSVRLKIVGRRISPAVCGLLWPVILLPRELAEKLSPGQLRAVLLHELIHLRRRDVWVNFLQALLQILYWWHPLVWLANARIRRVREEAVDDAVMLALRDEAESYAPTLLEVARLALNRPLVTLGLVGIMESRHALRQRIERLVDFCPPPTAGLTLVSLLGILAFTAVAVPMGEGPDFPAKSDVPTTAVTGPQSLTVKVNSEIFFRNLKAQAAKAMQSPTNFWGDILMELLRDEGVDCNPPHGLAFTNATGDLTTQNTPEQLEVFRRVVEQLNRADGICELPLGDNPLRKSVLIEGRIYPMSDGEFDSLTSGLHRYSDGSSGEAWWLVSPETFKQFVSNIEASGLTLIQRPRIQTGNGIAATLYVGDATNSLELACKPIVGKGFVDLTLESTVISGVPANAFTNHVFSKASAEDHGGIVLRMANYGGYAGSNLVVLISAEILTNVPTSRHQQGLAPAGAVNVTGVGSDPNYRVVLKALEQRSGAKTLAEPEVTTTSGRGVNRIRTDNISTMLAHPVLESSNLITMTFKIERPVPQSELKGKLRNAGVEIPPTVFFYQDNGMMLVRGYSEQLGLVERLVMKLNGYSPKKNEADTEQFTKKTSNLGLEERPILPMTNLYSRHFRVDAKKLTAGLRKATGAENDDIPIMARNFFSTLGVNLNLPGKSVFFNDGLDELFVRATEADLDTVQSALAMFVYVAPQIHIKARFLEVPKGTLDGLKKVVSVTNPPALSNQVAGLVGILTDKNFRTVLRNLEARPGVEVLAEPEVVTTSGRQTQMRATTEIEVDVFNDVVVKRPVKPLEVGPVLDVVPYVLSDGYTVNLTLNPSLTELLVSSNSAPKNLPGFRVRQVVTTLNLWDNQTVIISGLPEKDYVKGKEVFDKAKASDKELLVFVTATIVDPAGNRVHSDEAVPGYYDDVTPRNTQ